MGNRALPMVREIENRCKRKYGCLLVLLSVYRAAFNGIRATHNPIAFRDARRAASEVLDIA
jgi:hypothetical protein